MKCQHRDCQDRRAVELTSIGLVKSARSLREGRRRVTCTRELCECGGAIKTGPDRGCVDCTRLDGAGHAQHDVIMLLRIEAQPCSTRYIAEQSGRSINTAFMLLSRMKRAGLLRRSMRPGGEYEGPRWNIGIGRKHMAPEAYWSLGA